MEGKKQLTKASDRFIKCLDCGIEFVGHFATKRCKPCSIARQKKKQKEYMFGYYRTESYKRRRRERNKRAYHKDIEASRRKKREKYQGNKDYYTAFNNSPERVEYMRQYRQDPEFKKREKKREADKRKRGIGRKAASKYRSKKMKALLPSTDLEAIDLIYREAKEKSDETNTEYHVDHIIPISIGGAHHQDNLRVITAKENLSKNNKYDPSLGGVWANNDLAKKTKKGIK